MKWPFAMKQKRPSRAQHLSERWGMENCRLWEMLIWIDTYEPEIVAAAEDRFGVDVNQAVVHARPKEPFHDH